MCIALRRGESLVFLDENTIALVSYQVEKAAFTELLMTRPCCEWTRHGHHPASPGRPTPTQSNHETSHAQPGSAHVSPIQPRSPLFMLAREARASACARLRFLPWQPWWEIRVSGSDVYHTLRGGSATAPLRLFGLACVADQISRSAARIVFATLRGGSDFRDCNENILLFFSSTQAREI